MVKEKLLTCCFLKGFFSPPHIKKLFETYDGCVQEIVDITQDFTLSTVQKKEKLQNLRQAFLKPDTFFYKTKAVLLRKLFDKENLDISLYTEMLEAYEEDMETKELLIWEELVTKAYKKASPLARMVMATYQENPSTYMPAENLCLVWQIFEIMNNLKEDQSRNKRCLLPSDILYEYQARPTDFALEKMTKEASNVLNEIYSRTQAMQADIKILPSLIKNKRLKLKMFVILSLTNLVLESTKKNILQEPFHLTFFLRMKAYVRAVLKILFA